MAKKKTTKVEETPSIDLTQIKQEEQPQELKMQGLGDLIKKATTALGIEQCDPCKKRQERFNKMFKWLYPKRMFTQEEIDMLNLIEGSKQISNPREFFKLYNEVFGDKLQVCSCSGLAKKMVERLCNWRNEQLTITTEETNNENK